MHELPPDFDPEIERTLLSRLRQRRQETIQHAMSDPSSSTSGRVPHPNPDRPEGPNSDPLVEGIIVSDHQDEHDNVDALSDQNDVEQEPVSDLTSKTLISLLDRLSRQTW